MEGAFAIIDDILIVDHDLDHHDQILKQVDKCSIRQPSVTYMGHIISSQVLQVDPEKVLAIIGMPAQTDKDGIRRFLGLVQYVSKFIPRLSEIDVPVRILLKENIDFNCEFEQDSNN